jgi:opacity protein-like surface antigen
MRKLVVLAGIALLTFNANAQEEKGLKGAWFATSQFGYQQTKTADAKQTNLTVVPIVGTFVSPSVAVGAGIGMINIKNEDAGGINADTGLLVVEPLVRKYWNIAGNFYFFGQLASPIISGVEKESNLKVTQFGLSMSGGFDFFVTKNFSVEFSYDLANFTQTTLKPDAGVKTTVTNFSLAHVANTEPVYIDTLGGSLPNLTTPLSFGFKFIF